MVRCIFGSVCACVCVYVCVCEKVIGPIRLSKGYVHNHVYSSHPEIYYTKYTDPQSDPGQSDPGFSTSVYKLKVFGNCSFYYSMTVLQ